MPLIVDDEHFQSFAAVLEQAIEKYGNLEEEDLLARQKRQVEKLVKLEKDLRKTLIAHPWGGTVYRAFISMICDERRNILAARPFFRERQPVFTQRISKALKARDEKALQRFHFNYTFVTFVLKSRKWPKGSQIVKLAKEIADIRQEIVEMNMPLAISRASIFWRKTPKAQLSYMDLVQIACEGLMSAVDKFCLPFSRVFRAVAIGRMLGNFIEQYSETLVHFYPVDKRKIYRANKLMKHFPDGVDFDLLAAAVNKEVDDGHLTTPAEIADLLAAASCVSTDTSAPNDPEESDVLDVYVADVTAQPDYQYEQQEARQVLAAALSSLAPLERKLLKMKGITL